MSTSNTIPSASIIQSNTIDISSIEEGKAQILSDIAELQNIEKEYFTTLNNGLAQNIISPEEKSMLVQKINEISQMRMNLYKNLNGMYNFYQANLSSTRDTMDEQNVAINIVETEINDAKRKLRLIEEEKNNKLRLVEINSYYGEKYNDHKKIMQTVIFIFVPILVLTILYNIGFLTRAIYIVLFVLVAVIGAIYLGKQLILASSHDNMNYQEYDWNFNPNNAPPLDTQNMSSVDPWANQSSVCIGQQCCDVGFIYNSDPSINKCLPMS